MIGTIRVLRDAKAFHSFFRQRDSNVCKGAYSTGLSSGSFVGGEPFGVLLRLFSPFCLANLDYVNPFRRDLWSVCSPSSPKTPLMGLQVIEV